MAFAHVRMKCSYYANAYSSTKMGAVRIKERSKFMKKAELVEKAYKLGKEYEKTYRGCSY